MSLRMHEIRNRQNKLKEKTKFCFLFVIKLFEICVGSKPLFRLYSFVHLIFFMDTFHLIWRNWLGTVCAALRVDFDNIYKTIFVQLSHSLKKHAPFLRNAKFEMI